MSERVALHQPGLFVVEISAAIARRTGSRQLAVEAGRAVLDWPKLRMHELDHALAAEAADIAATLALRSADAVYVATARSAGAVLVTLDDKISTRAAKAVEVNSPTEWLQLHNQGEVARAGGQL